MPVIPQTTLSPMEPTYIRTNQPGRARILVWFAFGALILSLPLLFNIVNRVRAESDMRMAVQQMTIQVDASKIKAAKLQKALDYAKSDAFVEQWARVQARWAKSGEVVMLPSFSERSQRMAHPWWEEFVSGG